MSYAFIEWIQIGNVTARCIHDESGSWEVLLPWRWWVWEVVKVQRVDDEEDPEGEEEGEYVADGKATAMAGSASSYPVHLHCDF